MFSNVIYAWFTYKSKRVRVSVRANDPVQPKREFYFEIEVLGHKKKAVSAAPILCFTVSI